MSVRRPLVRVGGRIRQLPTGDTLPGVRELLTAARTYYVRTDGSDSNTGLSNTSGGAFATIQKAVDTAASLDLGLYDIVINVGIGTWTAPTLLRTLTGAGKVTIRGINNNTTDTVISTNSADCFGGEFFGRYHFEYLKLQTTTSGACLFVQGSGILVTWANINFGQTAGQHLLVANGAQIKATGSYQISGGAASHIATYDVCTAYFVGYTVTITNTPTFLNAFIVAERNCSVIFVQATFAGSATGIRYRSAFSSSVVTNGGENYLPGNSAGVRETGGQYS